jgi:hypothetical protein
VQAYLEKKKYIVEIGDTKVLDLPNRNVSHTSTVNTLLACVLAFDVASCITFLVILISALTLQGCAAFLHQENDVSARIVCTYLNKRIFVGTLLLRQKSPEQEEQPLLSQKKFEIFKEQFMRFF